MKTRKSIVYGLFAVILALAFSACEPDPGEGDPPSPPKPALSGSIIITTDGTTPVTTAVTAGTTLIAYYSGDEDVNYQWYHNGDPMKAVKADTDTFKPLRNGSYKVLVSAEGYESKFSAAVDVTGETPPEQWPEEDRWYKWTADGSTASVDYEVGTFDSTDDVCKITVGGTATDIWNRYQATVNYEYTGKKDTRYKYEFEAWTDDSNERTLGIVYYNDYDGDETVLRAWPKTISTRQTYTIYGQALPENRDYSALEFNCADQTGTFYVKILSIEEYTGSEPAEEYTVDDWPEAERWSSWTHETNATIAHSVDDDVCTITVGGTAEQDAWWKASAEYAYTAKANTVYKYIFEAWTDSGGDRIMHVQYYSDNDTEEYRGKDISVTNTRKTHEVTGEVIKGGVRRLSLQCANQTGKFYVKILEIRPLEGPPENWSYEDRWSYYYDPSSTAKMNHYSVSNDGECTITIGGTPGNDEWEIRTRYAYTANENTNYIYSFKAWTDAPGGGHVTLSYWDGDTHEIWIWYGESIELTSTETTYTIYGLKTPEGSGSTSMDFLWGDQTGTFHVKDLVIAEYQTGELTVTNLPSSPDYMIGGYGYAYFEVNDEQLILDFVLTKVTGTTMTFDVRKYEDGYTPFIGNVTVPENQLLITIELISESEESEGHIEYTNTVPITFTNGNATIDFNSVSMTSQW